MDNQVKDFLNEINEIAPPSSKPLQNKAWKQCFDELTGYAYYWNKHTDEVTWNPPDGFKQSKTKPTPQVSPQVPPQEQKRLYVPTGGPLLTGINKPKPVPPKDQMKIYTVGENSKRVSQLSKVAQKEPQKRRHAKDDDESEDEKIVLISSYGTDSDSEDEPPDLKKPKRQKTSSVGSDKLNSDEDDDLDILAKIQKRAQELKELGGDIPVEVKKVVQTSKKELLNSPKKVTLVAGYYSDSDDENEEIRNVMQAKPKPEPFHVSHSTLFPVPQPINVNDFIPPEPEVNNTNVNNVDNFDTKLFMRKKKIAVPVVTTVKKESEEESRKGFGFDKNATPSSEKIGENVYPGFRKGGVAFVKSDVLNPNVNNSEEQNSQAKASEDEEKLVNREEIDNMYSTLKDKLTFLNEGRPAISSVQAMVVQAETLIVAMNDGALKGSYLQKWLEGMCMELKKLEKEAAPLGWMLQWDRIHRRYFYQNRFTGTSQWEYPQPDMNTCDVAMDISTTPPPPNYVEPTPEEMSPPLPPPPTIRSPTPPPPPVISGIMEMEKPGHEILDVPLPHEAVSQKSANGLGQPLPPGVDAPEVTPAPQPKDSLNSALDSFYSDIAAISSSPPPPAQPIEEQIFENVAVAAEFHTETVKKKKKTKVKLAPGLSMKKKGVSQLVEKWKSVQQEYKN